MTMDEKYGGSDEASGERWEQRVRNINNACPAP